MSCLVVSHRPSSATFPPAGRGPSLALYFPSKISARYEYCAVLSKTGASTLPDLYASAFRRRRSWREMDPRSVPESMDAGRLGYNSSHRFRTRLEVKSSYRLQIPEHCESLSDDRFLSTETYDQTVRLT